MRLSAFFVDFIRLIWYDNYTYLSAGRRLRRMGFTNNNEARGGEGEKFIGLVPAVKERYLKIKEAGFLACLFSMDFCRISAKGGWVEL